MRKLGYILLTFAGISCLLGSILTWRETKNFLKTSVQTEGTIVEVNNSSSKVSFRTPESSFTFFSTLPSYEKGERVAVVYDPTDPEHAYINSFWRTNLQCVFFFLFGILLIYAGMVRFVFSFLYKQKLHHLKTHSRSKKITGIIIRIEDITDKPKKYRLFFSFYATHTNELGKPYHYKSPTLFRPKKFLKVGDAITILVDFESPKVYAMEIPHFSEMI